MPKLCTRGRRSRKMVRILIRVIIHIIVNGFWEEGEGVLFGVHRTFSNLLHRSLAFPWHSRLFPTISVCSMTISICSVSLRYLLICSVIRPFRVFCLFPPISLFWLVSFQFSILGSDRSESGSLLSICLHSCSATIPFPVDLRVYCPLTLWPPFPLRIMIRFLLFYSVYKPGKLCSYSLACNQTKPPVSWPRSTLNPQSLSISVPASQPHSRSLHYFCKPCSVRKS